MHELDEQFAMLRTAFLDARHRGTLASINLRRARRSQPLLYVFWLQVDLKNMRKGDREDTSSRDRGKAALLVRGKGQS